MLIYPEAQRGANSVTVDGYSNRKTARGAIREIGRYIRDNIDFDEGQSIIDYPTECRIPYEYKKQGCYFLEVEDVPCASRYPDGDPDNEPEYTDANFYIVCRVIL